jgi:alkylation response protein AidB-like acyl-CoA dehydrogenase
MNFNLTEDQHAVKEAARDFAQNELLPGVIDRDRDMIYPTDQVRMMGEMGFLGMMVSPEYGGGGMDTMSYVLAMEEISKIDASCSVIMSVNNSLVCWGLEKYGTEEQKLKYLTKLATGEWIGAFCLPASAQSQKIRETITCSMGQKTGLPTEGNPPSTW